MRSCTKAQCFYVANSGWRDRRTAWLYKLCPLSVAGYKPLKHKRVCSLLLVKILLLWLWACFPLSLSLFLALYSPTYLSHSSLQYTGAVLMEFLSRLHLSANHVTSCRIASCMSQLATSWGTLRRMCLSCVSGGTPKSIAVLSQFFPLKPSHQRSHHHNWENKT